jgi:hypothetical protein
LSLESDQASFAPHSVQKAALAAIATPHWGHVVVTEEGAGPDPGSGGGTPAAVGAATAGAAGSGGGM